MVFSYCYHGSVDEAFAVMDARGHTVAREGNVGPPVPLDATTRAIEFNDVEMLEAALADGRVACVLAEPAMTNMGIILPDDGYHDVLRELTGNSGTLLIIDETHTFSAGPGGCTAAWELEPDMLTIGKAIGSGVPSGALGLSFRVAKAMAQQQGADYEDTGGVGGTLAGNALSAAAMRATLASRAHRGGVRAHDPACDALRGRRCASCSRSTSCRGRSRSWARGRSTGSCPSRRATAPRRTRRATPSWSAILHLYTLNRGVLITPFHNMALMSPAHHRGGRGPPHRGVRGGARGAGGLTCGRSCWPTSRRRWTPR